ncbi:MAG: 1-acyl-sn-glycerol-3-phosphate acyltransferase [Clostridia bacterium]|nr:1-acyl-sn-glycerol-3-phosphate acyltransferase [Clostridia bacterium]
MKNFLHTCAVILCSIPLGLYLIFIAICCLFVKNKQYEKDNKFYRFLLDSLTAWLLWYLGVKIRVEGKEIVPQDERFVLVGNHVSNFDSIVTWRVLRKEELAYLSKASNFKIPFFGKLVRKCCFLEIDRENPRNAVKTVEKAAELIKKDEVSIGVYPEGTRAKDGVMLPFHNAMFKIAQRGDAPLVVCAVCGTNEIHKHAPWRLTYVDLHFIEVIGKEEVKEMRTSEIGERVKAKIQRVIENTEEKTV